MELRSASGIHPTWEGSGGSLNTHSLSEVIVYYKEGDASSEYIRECEVKLTDGTWKNLAQAFRDRDVITDNYNTAFREPISTEEKARGYYD